MRKERELKGHLISEVLGHVQNDVVGGLLNDDGAADKDAIRRSASGIVCHIYY